jgi:lipopolysaccharide biosynthesis regulator YciM
LLLIHQRGKDWERAIETGLKLEGRGASSMRPLIAHFYCEQAEQALQNSERSRAMQLLKRALSTDSGCVRASLQLGLLERAQGNYRAALKAFVRVERQDPAFLPEALEPMRECYSALRQPQALLRELQRIAEANPGGAIHMALADVIGEVEGARAAADYLVATVRQTPSLSGAARLVNLVAERVSDEARRDLETIRRTFADLLAERNGYECRQCGFPGRNLHWQCPSCRYWGTVKPTLV